MICRARDGINIINSLPFDTFLTVLEYVHRQMIKATTSNGDSKGMLKNTNPVLKMPEIDNDTDDRSLSTAEGVVSKNRLLNDDDNALEELERLVGIPREQFLLLIKTFSYILRRIGTYLIRPLLLQKELRETLHLNDELKIAAIVRLWNRDTAPMLQDLANRPYEYHQVTDVSWKLNVEISSQCQQRQKKALAMLQLRTGAGDDLNLEMDHCALQQLYRQLEEVQGELDSLARGEMAAKS